jgi:hypothetical protein
MLTVMRKISTGILLLGVSALAIAQSTGGDFVITKHTIDGGGGSSSGGGFSLTGTIGQADASTQPSTGGGFSVAGGFWAYSVELGEVIFKDGFETIVQEDPKE